MRQSIVKALTLAAAVAVTTVSAVAMADAEPAPAAQTAQTAQTAPPAVAAAASPAPSTGTPLTLRPSKPLSGALAETPASHTQSSVAKGIGAAVILAAGAFALRFRRKKTKPAVQAPALRVLRRTSLGPRSELVLIEADGQQLLLGSTPQSIQLLAMMGPLDNAAIHEQAADDDEPRARDQDRDHARERPRARASAEAANARGPGNQGERFAALLRAGGVEPDERVPSSAPARIQKKAVREEPLEGQVRSLASWAPRR